MPPRNPAQTSPVDVEREAYEPSWYRVLAGLHRGGSHGTSSRDAVRLNEDPGAAGSRPDGPARKPAVSGLDRLS